MLTTSKRVTLDSGTGSPRGGDVIVFQNQSGPEQVRVSFLNVDMKWVDGPAHFLGFLIKTPTTCVHLVLPVPLNLVNGWLLDRLRWQGQCRFKDYTVTHHQGSQLTNEVLVFSRLLPREPSLLATAIFGPSFQLDHIRVVVDTDANLLGIAAIELHPKKGPKKVLAPVYQEAKRNHTRQSIKLPRGGPDVK